MHLREEAVPLPSGVGLLDFGADLLYGNEIGIREHAETRRLSYVLVFRFIGAREDFFHVGMGCRNHVHGDQFTHAAGSSGSGVGSGFYGSYVSANGNGDEARSDEFLAHQYDLGSLYHRVCGFNCSYQAFGFDHS